MGHYGGTLTDLNIALHVGFYLAIIIDLYLGPKTAFL
jgi:hypothetical protein